MAEHVTFCRICEPLCGMVATVEDGKVTKLRPDGEHPLSQGFACPKGIAMSQVHNDEDRILYPQRRRADGSFERVSWEQALSEIAERLHDVIDTHGRDSVAWYMGNPGAFSYSHPLWVKGFLDGLGSPHYYTAASQDINNRFAASALLYGSPLMVPIPDLQRTDFLLMVGANPLVSHGSLLSAPRIREQLRAIDDRGGRVVVVDPRRSETAGAHEHLPVRPDGDAPMLLSLLHVLFSEGLIDHEAVDDQARGLQGLAAMCAAWNPEMAAELSGVAPDTIRALAWDLAAADQAAVYGRTGSCLGRFGTLVSFLLDALNVVTGNLDAPGGAVFGEPPLALDDIAERFGLATYGAVRSRLGGFPDVIGNLPASLMAKEITTPGPGQIRAMFVSAGNPMLSCPNGDELSEALDEVELHVALDIYRNETNAKADYLLPTTTFLEREDLPIVFLGFFTTPFIQYTEPVVEPAGEARQEWEIIEDLARPLGVTPSSIWPLRLLGRTGVRLTPQRLVDLLLRTGPRGDLFGLRRGGLSLARLRDRPHGEILDEHIETGVLAAKVRHRDRRVRLDPPEIVGEVRRLARAGRGDPRFPLRLIGLRELRSHNSWMHNAPLLLRGGRTVAARVHPDDAEAAGLAEGQPAYLRSPHGEIELEVMVTDEVSRGTVAVPHGWGHGRGAGWTRANETGGANVNQLASSDPADLERLAGMAHLNGIAVRLDPVAERDDEAGAAAEPAAATVAS
ncbi:MAG: molybdopterin-containing oxidoreductase family protein [Solirubrobacterales bacterium]